MLNDLRRKVMLETTDQYHRVKTGKPTKKDAEIRTIKIIEDIKAHYDFKNKVIIAYLFDVDKYTMKDAKKWVKDHKDSKSHATLVDIDYTLCKRNESWAAIKEEAMEMVLEEAANLMRE